MAIIRSVPLKMGLIAVEQMFCGRISTHTVVPTSENNVASTAPAAKS